jgi:hypothetical protein
MKTRTLLVLAIVVAVLGAAVYLFEGDLPSTDERAAKSKKVVPVDASEITALELEWQGKKVRLERDPKSAEKEKAGEANSLGAADAPRKWRMLEPFATPADTAAADGFAGQLAGLDAERDLAGAARKDVGLEPPRGKVTWRSPDASGTLEVGGKVPASGEVVVASSARKEPAVVSDFFVTQLERAPGEWRSREVVTAERAKVEKLTVAVPGSPPVVLAKSGEAFRLEAPVADVADREAVDQLLSDLAGLRVETFLDAPLTENTAAALAAPAGTIELRVAGEESPLMIELGGGEPMPGKRIARAAGQAFVATTKLLDSVTRPAAAWRSRLWTRFESWRIERLTVEDAVGKLLLERKDGNWLRDGKEIPFSAASDLLYAVSSAKADSLRDDPAGAISAGKPVLTLTLADADGKEETLTLHAPESGLSPARASGRDVTLLLPASAVAEVTSKLGALRAAQPAAAAPEIPASGTSEAPKPE